MNDNKQILSVPQDIEAEQAVLGSIILDNEELNKVSSILEPKTFHEESHQHIFRAMLSLSEEKQPIDEILLGGQLRKSGKLDDICGYPYLAELAVCDTGSGNIVYHARIIHEHFLAREIISITNNIGRKSRDPKQNIADLLTEAQTQISEIAIKSNKKSYRHIKDVLTENFKNIEEISESGDPISGLRTGFIPIDKMTSGLQPAGLIVIAARPSMGKTSLAVNIGLYAANTQPEKGAVLIFSLETKDTLISSRMLSSDSQIDSKKFRSGNMDQEDWDKLAMSAEKISSIPLYINDSSKISPDEMVNISKQLNEENENGVSLVIVDYLQLAQGRGNPMLREQEIANITRTLKGLAKDLNIPVIALSQLNRSLESRSDKRPVLSDLRESGAIEQDADVIMMIYRDEVYNEESEFKGIAEIIFRKHKDGACGPVRLGFVPEYTKFYNLGERAL